MSSEHTEAKPALHDADALRERYRLEREKRLRSDGNDQYIEVAGEFAHFVDDPYVEAGFEREPIDQEMDVLLIGGGFGGLQAGARMRDVGIEDIWMVEKGGDVGGTWYWNRYPGAQCDIESYIYLPLLEELGRMPKEKYSYAPEILEHSRAIAEHYDLYRHALFQTEVTGMTWDQDSDRWLVETNRGDCLRPRFVAMANGPMHRPKLPGIAGIRDFDGHTFHTSRWDYAYTGGGPDGNLDKLNDKRVAIIGTGATAVQVVPHVGAAAEQLYVFQRTPSSIDVRGNRPTDPAWAKSLQPGWQKARMENFNSLVSGVPQAEDLVDDGWTDLIGKMVSLFRRGQSGELEGMSVPEIMETANFEKMNEIRALVDEVVDDPATAEALKPWYKMFCKRPCFHDDYLPTFNRPNVKLVDTDGKGVEKITKKGVVVDGVEYEVDCIIFATGFEVGTSYERRAGYDIVGAKGQTLTDYWENGPRTFHGMQIHGYPNCFIMSILQGAFTANFPHLLDEVAVHQAHIIKHALDNGFTRVEATPEAEEAWVQEVIEKSVGSPIGGPDCTPGYYNNEGQPNPFVKQASPYGGGSIVFFDMLKQWRDAGRFEGMEFR